MNLSGSSLWFIYVYHCLFLINGEVTDGGERSHEKRFFKKKCWPTIQDSLAGATSRNTRCLPFIERREPWEPWFHSGRVMQRLKLGAAQRG